MTKFYPHATALLIGASFMVSCGTDSDTRMLAGSSQASVGEGEALYAKAKAADDRGKRSSAIKQYGKVADKYPMAPSSADARFRQAELLEQSGEVLKSFDAYQKFLITYQGSGRYSEALRRQAKMAQGAADGEVKNSFLGLKSRLDTKKVAEMLGKVRDNAPRSETSAKAQFTIGELYQSRGETKDSINAYQQLVKDQPDSKYSAEALFRVGVVLMAAADAGNHNQANLDLAGEAFDDYLLQYPGHAKNAEARKLRNSLKGRDLEQSLDIAEFYYRSEQYESAKVYYREVVKNSKFGTAHDKAQARLKELGE
ncbi:tetratricopeptide repeat protein [Luteolibacter sp. AS25]|uniref:tetratricopeptide repeat protein n=1 Tax=Luteolibacter sp. AS25 TaxID=3135776 RepID=UPI00398BAD9B